MMSGPAVKIDASGLGAAVAAAAGAVTAAAGAVASAALSAGKVAGGTAAAPDADKAEFYRDKLYADAEKAFKSDSSIVNIIKVTRFYPKMMELADTLTGVDGAVKKKVVLGLLTKLVQTQGQGDMASVLNYIQQVLPLHIDIGVSISNGNLQINLKKCCGGCLS